tara:strand:- start:238 stop:405 length:168 start_codon:yes stop_codon:yes gene_type:complete
MTSKLNRLKIFLKFKKLKKIIEIETNNSKIISFDGNISIFPNPATIITKYFAEFT